MLVASQGSAAGCAEAGFHDLWRQRASAAIDSAVRDAHAEDEQPVYDAYGRLEGLHGLHTSMSTLMLEAEKADVEDAPTLLE